VSRLVDVLRNHVEYTTWATNRLLHAGGALTPEQRQQDFGTADKSVLGTMVHLFRAERLWLQRLQFGTPKIPWGLAQDEQWSFIAEQWPDLHKQWQSWAAVLTEDDADRLIHYSDLKGRAWSQPICPLVLHVVNHSTHHRGQVSGFLRALGQTPPPLDFIFFVREKTK
jgi:uncharacterized damage-inducible protein DinB